MRVFQGDKELKFKKLEEIYEEEKIELVFKEKNIFHPPKSHPFKGQSYCHKEKEPKMKMAV